MPSPSSMPHDSQPAENKLAGKYGRQPSRSASNAFGGNALAIGTPAANGPLPTAPPPQTAASAPIPPSAAIAALPGQQQATEVGQKLNVSQLSDSNLATHTDRLLYLQNGLRGLLQKKDIDHSDVVHLLADALKNGGVQIEEAPAILNGVPVNPSKLRAEIERRHVIALHASVHLVGEQQRRAAQKGQ